MLIKCTSTTNTQFILRPLLFVALQHNLHSKNVPIIINKIIYNGSESWQRAHGDPPKLDQTLFLKQEWSQSTKIPLHQQEKERAQQ